MCTGSGLDQLAGDTDFAARLSDTALQDIADAQFSSDLLNLDSLPLVGEA